MTIDYSPVPTYINFFPICGKRKTTISLGPLSLNYSPLILSHIAAMSNQGLHLLIVALGTYKKYL